MSKRTRITVIVAAAVLALIAIGYFFALPQVQANSYSATVKEKQPALREQMQRLVDLLDRDVFTKSEPELGTIRTDIKAGQDVLADVKNQLATSNDSLTTFTEYPLLSWSSPYKSSLELNKAEKTYINEARLATDEMEKVLAYSDKVADFLSETKSAETKLDNLENASSLEELTKTLEGIIKQLDTAIKKMGAVAPPESYKESHEYNVKVSGEVLGALRKMVTALKTMQLDQIDQLGRDVQKLQDTYDKKQDELTKKFLSESVLRQHIDKMLDADREIKKHLG